VREIWKPIPSLLAYEASSHGRVRRVPYQAPMPNGGTRTYGGRPTFGGARKDKAGRRYIMFQGKNYSVARLVCEAFHGPQPAPYPEAVCMHLNENCTDNRACNLAWGSQKENLNAPGFIAYCKSRTGDQNPFVKGSKR
jgi:hypothetical protein